MPPRTEVRRDGAVSRKQRLSVARGREPLPPSLPLAGRLV